MTNDLVGATHRIKGVLDEGKGQGMVHFLPVLDSKRLREMSGEVPHSSGGSRNLLVLHKKRHTVLDKVLKTCQFCFLLEAICSIQN